jgi:membrane associated rhomboid family serine protease/predicted negative regulator of RcsB-dependent stress response
MANCIQCGRKLPGFSFGRKICQWCVQHEAAKRGEEGDDAVQQVMPTPWVRRGESSITLNHVIFGANVAVFVAMVIANKSIDDFPGRLEADFGANYGPWTLSGDWWRLFTYMFLHGGVLHIAMNMWCLWNIGTLCEALYGRWTYATIYVITGIAGGLASVGWNPGVLSVGASGALFGLTGALIASFYLGEFSLSGISIKGTLSSLVFFAGFNLFFGSMFPGIDNACHVGGLISGLILGGLIAVAAPDQNATLRRAGVVALVALAVIGAALGVRSWRGGEFRVARAMRALSEDDPAHAIEQLREIVRQQPNLSQAHFALAQALFNQERYAEAEPEFKRVLELQPENSGARFNLGMVYLSEKKLQEATNLYAQAIAKDKNDADAHYGLGLVLADQDKTADAIEPFSSREKSKATAPTWRARWPRPMRQRE